MHAEDALELNRDRLMSIRGVAGVGLGLDSGQKVIVVMCEGPAEKMSARLPRELEGNRVVVRETGPVRAF